MSPYPRPLALLLHPKCGSLLTPGAAPSGQSLSVVWALQPLTPMSPWVSSLLLVPLTPPPPQVYWVGPVLGAVLAGLCYEFIFAPGASREKLCACLTCRDVTLVETTTPSLSSPATTPLGAARTPPASQGQGTA